MKLKVLTPMLLIGLLIFSGCGGGGSSGTTSSIGQKGLAKIKAYKNSGGTSNVPTEADYATAGVVDVNASNITALNRYILLLNISKIDTKSELQGIVDNNDYVDNDGDGIGQGLDTSPDDPDVPFMDGDSDTDSDGTPNGADTDDDNDGVLDTADAFPLDAGETIDTDNDGTGNNADTDDDNDGVSDVIEGLAGTDPLNALSFPTTVAISGKITYDLVPVNSNHVGLDYTNITQEAAKNVVVELLNASNVPLDITTTDDAGDYNFIGITLNVDVKVRVSAKMFKIGAPNWDVQVVNNNAENSLYVMEGSLVSSGAVDSSRNLNAPSGWGGSSYTGTRVAAPFAMLDTINSAMSKILDANATATFPPLKVNWYAGSTKGTYYTDGKLFIVGDANSDTDEYDDHVIAHEWGHYYEDKFSRSDSVGGSHGSGDRLDIRVAFGEGWGNAFSGIALDDSIYFDTAGSNQASGFNFNLETQTQDTPGWYSEASIQRILYDIYDTNDDGSDTLSLGFAAMHQVFVGTQKTTDAYTSIFTFITALKAQNFGDAEAIDSIVGSENIAAINDIFGTGRTNFVAPNYEVLTVGTTVNVCPTYTYGSVNTNKLGNHKYLKVNIGTAESYTLTVTRSNTSATTDPDFQLYNTNTEGYSMIGGGDNPNTETKTANLAPANYLLDVSDYNAVDGACFDVNITN